MASALSFLLHLVTSPNRGQQSWLRSGRKKKQILLLLLFAASQGQCRVTEVLLPGLSSSHSSRDPWDGEGRKGSWH